MSQLTELEMAAWRGLLRTRDALWKTLEARMVRESGITMTEYEVLLLLEEAGETGVRMAQLAQALSFSGGGLTRLADRLQEEGYLERRRCDADGRGFEALLTPAGRMKLKRVHVMHLRAVRSLFLNRLTVEEQKQLAGIWAKLATPAPAAEENQEESE